MAEAAFLIFVLGTAIYMGHRTKGSSTAPAVPVSDTAPPSFANFCSRAHLVPKAFDDCRKAMSAAKNDAERAAIERRFAMGGVQIDKPANIPP